MTAIRISPDGVGFATSGHTGRPVTWFRTHAQLRAEVTLVAGTLFGPVDRVVSFAPPEHLYGYLYGRLFPELLEVEVQDLSQHPLSLPELGDDRRTLFVCLPSSWQIMRRLVSQPDRLSTSIALHGTGPTTPATDQVLADLAGSGFRAFEIFGSTETGGIGYRSLSGGRDPHRAWQLLPDVELVVDPDESAPHLLHVRSPRLARPEGSLTVPKSIRLNDVIRPVGDRQFEFVGRRSRLVKINGRRCDLAQVEEQVTAAIPGLDVVCVAVVDPVRGEHYELFHCATSATHPPEALPARLSAVLGDLPMPRMIHRVDEIPRTVTGKIKLDRLFAMAVTSSGQST